ncbi:MAG: hypothetical protein M1839_008529 [Geoglossum umbratile]|nr:MAG: hypothetical protein M1839_008529 [Geoglossum umbratile]
MDIANPRRILIIEQPDSGVLSLLRDLTGTSPTPTTSTPAGLSHTLPLTTPYYSATIPIWIDQIPAARAPQWAAEYLTPDAADVLRALGAFVYVFRKPVDADALAVIKEGLGAVGTVVREGYGGGGGGLWDGVCLAVGTRQSEKPGLDVGAEEWDEVCRAVGFEYVDAEARGRNEFGEPTGLERIKEALEANDWAAADDDTLLPEDEAESGFGAEAAELEREMVGLKMAIYGGGEEEGEEEEEEEDGGAGGQEFQVEQLEAVMLRMQAVRDMSADLPEAERRKFAAKAVSDIMKTL